MTAALSIILNKLVVQPFYQRNTAFFLVVFFLGFGIQQPPTLLVSPPFLTEAIPSPVFVFSVLVLFLLYYLKCYNFIRKSISKPKSEFLYVAGLLPRRVILISLGLMHLQLFLPALAYTGLMSFYGLKTQNSWVAGIVALYNLLLLSITTFSFYHLLIKTIPPPRPRKLLSTGEKKLLGFPVLWPLRYLVRQEKVLLGLTKLLSLSILYLFMALYPYPAYDLRPTQIGFLTAIMAQAMLVQQVQHFQESGLTFLRQLPQARWQRFLRQGFLFGLLLLPEIIMLFRLNFSSETWLPLFLLAFFGLGILLLLYGLLYRGSAPRTYLRTVFFIYIGLLSILLFNPPLYLLAGSFYLLAWLVYYRSYYTYEV